MKTDLPSTDGEFRERVTALRELRNKRKRKEKRVPRARLTEEERANVLAKTGGHCHICGGEIDGEWQADHVLAHSAGGKCTHENFLAAHSLCNNYRWDYLPEEFQVILKLGVWARTQIERDTPLGRKISAGFLSHERKRASRRKVLLEG